jgi:hypothetical protein
MSVPDPGNARNGSCCNRELPNAKTVGDEETFEKAFHQEARALPSQLRNPRELILRRRGDLGRPNDNDTSRPQPSLRLSV